MPLCGLPGKLALLEKGTDTVCFWLKYSLVIVAGQRSRFVFLYQTAFSTAGFSAANLQCFRCIHQQRNISAAGSASGSQCLYFSALRDLKPAVSRMIFQYTRRMMGFCPKGGSAFFQNVYAFSALVTQAQACRSRAVRALPAVLCHARRLSAEYPDKPSDSNRYFFRHLIPSKSDDKKDPFSSLGHFAQPFCQLR